MHIHLGEDRDRSKFQDRKIMHKDRKNTEDLPLFKKGKEIMEVVHEMIELIPDDNEHLQCNCDLGR